MADTHSNPIKSASSILFSSIVMTIELVTPGIASQWLSLNIANRRLRPRVIAQYARDMTAGLWMFKPIAIAFDELGNLGNGQHTLSAIIESGCSQPLLVARHVPKKAIALMDRGLARTMSDVARMLGSDFESRAAAIARIVAYGPYESGKVRSFDELFEVYTNHSEAIDWAISLSPSKTIGFSAPSMAVMARASYTHSRAHIARFAEVVKHGVGIGAVESAAIRFRDFARSRGSVNGHAGRTETYEKAESALDNFLHDRPMSKLYGTSTELFPLPSLS